MAAVAIRCVRPCLHEGRALFAGEVVNVAPLVASDLLASGRCVLADPADAARVNAAVAERSDKMVRSLDAQERHARAAGWVRRVA